MAGSDAGRGSGEPGGLGIPRSVLRSWDEAEARLFPLVMAQPDVYQQSVSLIQRLLAHLRETCPDMATLLAAHEPGGELATTVLPEAAATRRPDLIAAAACAMRYRELAASLSARRRLAALAGARDQGLSWVVVEENGSLDRVPYVPYQRIEAEVASGRALIISIEPDETLSRAVHRLDRGQIDLATGGVQVGEPAGSYRDPAEFEAALGQARQAGRETGQPETPPPA